MTEHCWPEAYLELAVLETGTARRNGLALAPSWQSLVAHAANCERCWELMCFYGSVHGVETASSQVGTVIHLKPLRTPPSPGDEAASRSNSEFDLAAETKRPFRSVPLERELVLISDDGAWLVKIVSHADGSRAIAYLVARPEPQVGKATGETQNSARMRVFLSLGSGRFLFGDSRSIVLPAFPGEAVSLIVD